jgi:hypothetical protein
MIMKTDNHTIEFGDLTPDGKLTHVRYLSHETIAKCPLCIFDPDHYKADGTCLCFDKEHQDKLRADRKARREKILAAQAKINRKRGNES